MTTAKTTSERVAKMRADRDALGLKRLELYAHPEDWRAIKALAEKLQRKRSKPVRSAPPSPPQPPW
jgi:predicted component of type VI protein secretion system